VARFVIKFLSKKDKLDWMVKDEDEDGIRAADQEALLAFAGPQAEKNWGKAQ